MRHHPRVHCSAPGGVRLPRHQASTIQSSCSDPNRSRDLSRIPVALAPSTPRVAAASFDGHTCSAPSREPKRLLLLKSPVPTFGETGRIMWRLPAEKARALKNSVRQSSRLSRSWLQDLPPVPIGFTNRVSAGRSGCRHRPGVAGPPASTQPHDASGGCTAQPVWAREREAVQAPSADQRTQCPSHTSAGAISFRSAPICELYSQTRTLGRAEFQFYKRQ
jgi:hypothetical protein